MRFQSNSKVISNRIRKEHPATTLFNKFWSFPVVVVVEDMVVVVVVDLAANLLVPIFVVNLLFH